MVTTSISILCTLTSLLCMVLLVRGYRASGARLLLWSGVCFGCFAVSNALLIADMRFPSVDLSIVRSVPTALGLAVLLFGLVWEGR